jgi:hypothetical protein
VTLDGRTSWALTFSGVCLVVEHTPTIPLEKAPGSKASCSRKIPMICFSVNRLALILLSQSVAAFAEKNHI